MKVALTYNLKGDAGEGQDLPPDFYAECDDLETIEGVRDAILDVHEEVVLIEADEGAYERFRSERPDIVFNMAEGLWGESREAQVPAMLEMLRIPYTGSSPLTLGLCLNKARAKEILSHYGIPTPRFIVASDPGMEATTLLTPPVMVKPLYEGSSKGIRNDSLVTDPALLPGKLSSVIREYAQPALVEEYVGGREFTVAVLGNGDDLRVLPIVEINHAALPEGASPIYSYEAKWVYDTPEAPLDIFSCPADIPERLKTAIEEVATDAYRALDVRDWCRIDLRLDSRGVPNVLELNPLPGILMDPRCNSCFPKAARSAGMTYPELINTVITLASRRYGL